ncbi:MAG: hypothetical protein V3V31_15955 [Methylococcales bacterium]
MGINLRLSVFFACSVWAVSAQSGCKELVPATGFGDLEHWSGRIGVNIRKEANGVKVVDIKPAGLFGFGGGISRTIRVPVKSASLIVARARVKGTGLVPGDKKYRKAKLVLEYKDVNGSTIRRAQHLPTAFDWRDVFVVADIGENIKSVTLRLSNEARKGIFSAQSVSIQICDKKGIDSLDYPRRWSTLVKRTSGQQLLINPSQINWHPLKQDLLGYNLAYRVEQKKIANLLSLPDVTALYPNVVRFPSGIQANFYHWQYDGFDPADFKRFPAFDKPGVRNAYRQTSKGHGKHGLASVVKWVKAHGARLSLVLNVTTASNTEDLVGFISHVRNLGAEVKYIELGNELYFKEQGGDVVHDAHDYVKIVAPIIARLKKTFPDLPVGIPISHTKKEWNRVIQDARIPFDAVILHPYVDVSCVATVEQDLGLIHYSAKVLPELFSRVARRFTGKKIWVTEWNFQDQPYRRLTKTSTGALFSANGLLSMLDDGNVTAGMYFSLFSRGSGLLPVYTNAGPITSKEPSPALAFWQGIGEIFNQSTHTGKLDIKIKSTSEGISTASIGNVRIRAFRGEKNWHLLIVNNDLSKLILPISQLGTPTQNIPWHAITMSSSPEKETTKAKFYNTGTSEEHVAIEPMSVTWIGPFGLKDQNP